MLKARFFLVLILILVTSDSAYAIIGRTQTKRERMKAEANQSARYQEASYEKIQEAFLREDFGRAEKLCRQYLSGSWDWPDREDVQYLKALSLIKLNRGESARNELADLERDSRDPSRKANASVSIGDSYAYEENWGEAALSYEQSLRKYPQSDEASYLLFKLMELADQRGQKDEARAYKDRLLKEHADTEEAKKARGSFIFAPSSVSVPAAAWQKNAVEEKPFYTVQVGSFSNPVNANTLLARLLSRRYEAYLVPDDTHTMYRVRVGRLSSKIEARRLEGQLKREGLPTRIYP